MLAERHFKSILFRSAAVASLTLAAASGWAVVAHAADATATATDTAQSGSDTTEQSGRVSEIVVTALKVSQNLQTAPAPITAIGAVALAREHAMDLTQLSLAIPNVEFIGSAQFQSTIASFYIRGMGIGTVDSFIDPRVALYIDGSYQPRTQAGPGNLFDTKSVEVLSGPQGGLYGRGAEAGAILVTSNGPSDSFGGDVTGDFGNYQRRNITAALNIPINAGVLDTRTAVMLRHDSCFFTIANLSTNSIQQIDTKLGRDVSQYLGRQTGCVDEQMFRETIRFRPVNGVEGNLIYYYAHNGSDAGITNLMPQGSNLFATAPTVDLLQTQGWTAFNYYGYPNFGPKSGNPFLTSGGTDNDKVDQLDQSLTGNLSVNVFGGNWYTVANVTNSRGQIRTDTDSTLLDYFTSNRVDRYDVAQVDTRYTHDFWDDKVKALVGISYLRDYTHVWNWLEEGFGSAGNAAANPPILPVAVGLYSLDPRATSNLFGIVISHRTATSPYAQLTVTPIPNLDITGSLRYVVEDRDGTVFPLQNALSPSFVTGDLSQLGNTVALGTSCGPKSIHFTEISPGINVDYKVTPDVMVYALWQTGAHAGGLNMDGNCTQFLSPYADEKVNNFEIGEKGEFFDHRLRFNVSLFYSLYTNLQESSLQSPAGGAGVGSTIVSIITNAAGGRIYGAEFAGTAKPNDDWTVYGTLGLLKAEYTNFCANIFGTTTFAFGTAPPASTCATTTILAAATPTAAGRASVPTDNKHLQFPNAPSYEAHIGSNYVVHSRVGDITGDINASFIAGTWISGTNAAPNYRNAMTILNASLDWASPDQKYHVTLWGKNLTNDIAYLGGPDVVPDFQDETPTPPLTFGVTVAAKF